MVCFALFFDMKLIYLLIIWSHFFQSLGAELFIPLWLSQGWCFMLITKKMKKTTMRMTLCYLNRWRWPCRVSRWSFWRSSQGWYPQLLCLVKTLGLTWPEMGLVKIYSWGEGGMSPYFGQVQAYTWNISDYSKAKGTFSHPHPPPKETTPLHWLSSTMQWRTV